MSVLDLFGSVLTCQAYRAKAKFPKHAVETLVACSLMQFGEEERNKAQHLSISASLVYGMDTEFLEEECTTGVHYWCGD